MDGWAERKETTSPAHCERELRADMMCEVNNVVRESVRLARRKKEGRNRRTD